MNTNSITPLAAILMLVCTTCFAQPPGMMRQPPPKLTQVSDDVYVIENANASIGELIANGGNATVYLTDEGAVLFDTKSAQMHELVIQQVSSLTDKPIALVVLTHNHADHSAGVQLLQAKGATTIISAADRDNMNRQPNTASAQVAYSGSLLLTMGGKEIHLHEIQGHTQGDTIAWLPQPRVLIAGDLVTTTDAIPVIVNYEDGGSWIALKSALDKLAEYDFEYLISGHGPVISKGEFLTFRQKVTDIIARVRTMVGQGSGHEAIAEALLAEFNWGGGLATGNIPLMMQELK